jgi:hypothetical protein
LLHKTAFQLDGDDHRSWTKNVIVSTNKFKVKDRKYELREATKLLMIRY